MTNNRRIFYIKLVHTIIFLFMVGSLFYILFCCITRTFNLILLIAIAAILVEGLILMIFNWRCPFTMLAEKYGSDHGTVTDLFLPDWLARNTFKIFGTLFFVELIVLAVRYFGQI